MAEAYADLPLATPPPAAPPSSQPDISNILQQAGKFGLLPAAPPPPPTTDVSAITHAEQMAYPPPFDHAAFYGVVPKLEPGVVTRPSKFGLIPTAAGRDPMGVGLGQGTLTAAGKPVDILAAQKEALVEMGMPQGDGLLGAQPGVAIGPAPPMAAPTLVGALPPGVPTLFAAPPPGMPPPMVGRLPMAGARFPAGAPRMFRPRY